MEWRWCRLAADMFIIYPGGAAHSHSFINTTKPATPQDFHSFTLGMSTVSVALMLVQRVSGSASLPRLLSSQ